MTRVIDKAATKAARARHEEGRRRLLAIWFWHRTADGELGLDVHWMKTVHRAAYLRRLRATPWRLRPNTPPVRTPAMKARKRRRAIVKASRRRNRR